MKLVLWFAFVALLGYIFGYIVGKMSAEMEFEEKRKEMGLDKEPEDDWDKLYKE